MRAAADPSSGDQNGAMLKGSASQGGKEQEEKHKKASQGRKDRSTQRKTASKRRSGDSVTSEAVSVADERERVLAGSE